MIRLANSVKHFSLKFCGEDYNSVKDLENPKVKRNLIYIGFSIVLIGLGSFVSGLAFIIEVLNQRSIWISIPVGLFWALLVGNMYFLLLLTINPTRLPFRNKYTKKVKAKANDAAIDTNESKLNASLVYRLLFIILIALISAQPLIVLLFSWTIEPKLELYKLKYKANMILLVDSTLIKNEIKKQKEFYKFIGLRLNDTHKKDIYKNLHALDQKVVDDMLFLKESSLLMSRMEKNSKEDKNQQYLFNELKFILDKEIESDVLFTQQFRKIKFSESEIQREYDKYADELIGIVNNKVKSYEHLNKLIADSNFYVTRIQILWKEQPLSWLLTLTACSVFLIPIFLKRKIAKETPFYNTIENSEEEFIKSEYNSFIKSYENGFNLFGSEIPVQKYEHWANPPFNTIPKSAAKRYKSELDLLNDIYK